MSMPNQQSVKVTSTNENLGDLVMLSPDVVILSSISLCLYLRIEDWVLLC